MSETSQLWKSDYRKATLWWGLGRDYLNLLISLASSLPISKKKGRCSQNKLISVGMITHSVFYTLKPIYFVQLLQWWSVDCNLQFLQVFYAADNVLYNSADVIKASSKDVKKYLTPLYRPPTLSKQKWPHIGSSLLNPDLWAPTSLPAQTVSI